MISSLQKERARLFTKACSLPVKAAELRRRTRAPLGGQRPVTRGSGEVEARKVVREHARPRDLGLPAPTAERLSAGAIRLMPLEG